LYRCCTDIDAVVFRGGVWPLPWTIQYDSFNHTINPGEFRFISKVGSCDVIDKAIKRYQNLSFPLYDPVSFSDFCNISLKAKVLYIFLLMCFISLFVLTRPRFKHCGQTCAPESAFLAFRLTVNHCLMHCTTVFLAPAQGYKRKKDIAQGIVFNVCSAF
ncbi:hypothetical protein COOONC_13041, partial [Cooperia oncophora]